MNQMEGMFQILPQRVNPPIIFAEIGIGQGVRLIQLPETIKFGDRERPRRTGVRTPLTAVLPTEAVKYLGVRLTLYNSSTAQVRLLARPSSTNGSSNYDAHVLAAQ